MIRIFITILIVLSGMTAKSQLYKIYAIRCNANGSSDSLYKKHNTDSVFNSSNNFVSFTREYYQNFYEPNYPNGFANYVQRADGIWMHANCIVEYTTKIPTVVQVAINNKTTIYIGVDASANDSYSITATPEPSAYTTGMVIIFKANTANTTGCSININGLGSKTIVKRVSTTTATGDILAGMWCQLVYDGTNFVILNPVVN